MLKNADQIIGPALEEFYRRRPASFKHLNLRNGVYWHVFAGQRAQAALELQRLSQLIRANSLRAEGAELRDYVASEYTAPDQVDQLAAVGELVLTRPTGLTSGDIPKGTRFSRSGNPTSQIPIESAEYETLSDYHMNVGQLVTGPIPHKAVSRGEGSNHPIRTDATELQVFAGKTLFDPGLQVTAFSAAGGSDGLDDEYMRMFAKAYAKGQFGPTADATRYGGLNALGARNILVYDDIPNGVQRLLVADRSWASSDRWCKIVEQSIYDAKLVGFGCRVAVGPVRNVVVSVEADIVLRDWNYTSDTLEIDDYVRESVRAYFDDRPDWNVWKSRGLRSAITRAHRKILKCANVTVRDVSGAVLPEIATPDYGAEQFHYYLANRAVTATYSGPT